MFKIFLFPNEPKNAQTVVAENFMPLCKLIGVCFAKNTSEQARITIEAFNFERAALALDFKGWRFLGHTVYWKLRFHTQNTASNSYIAVPFTFISNFICYKDEMKTEF